MVVRVVDEKAVVGKAVTVVVDVVQTVAAADDAVGDDYCDVEGKDVVALSLVYQMVVDFGSTRMDTTSKEWTKKVFITRKIQLNTT